MLVEKTDVLVVGAGPAGCALGHLLKSEGVDVTIAEIRDTRTKDKLCGGIYANAVAGLLDECFGQGTSRALAAHHPGQTEYISLDGSYCDKTVTNTSPRKEFDGLCLKRYLSAGGRLKDRMRLASIDVDRHQATFEDLRTRERVCISYKTLVGADGVTSTVRFLTAHRHQRMIFTLQGDVERVRDTIAFMYRPGSLGYLWYIPYQETAVLGGGFKGELSSTLRLWLQEFSDRLNVTCPTLRGAFVPTGDDIMLAPVSDVYLIGDAAGLIAPGSWGGIYDALKSAKILARALNSGSSFEKDMQQTVANITGVSNDLWGYYFSRWLSVARKKVESTQITQDA